MSVPKSAVETTSAPGAPSSIKRLAQFFCKIQERLKSEPYFEPLNERLVRESAHSVTLCSGKILHKCDLSISLGGWDHETGGLKAVSPSGTAKQRDVQTEWVARNTGALVASTGQSPKPVTDHAGGTAENPFLIDISSEGLIWTESPGKDIEILPRTNTLPSERTVGHSQATGVEKEAQTFVLPRETSQGGIVLYSSSEEGKTLRMGSIPVPTNLIELSSTEDGEDESEETDKANTHEMDTQELQSSEKSNVIASTCANGHKAKRAKEPTTDKFGSKSGESPQTGYDGYYAQPRPLRMPASKFFGDRLFTSVVNGGALNVHVLRQTQNTSDEELEGVPKAATGITPKTVNCNRGGSYVLTSMS